MADPHHETLLSVWQNTVAADPRARALIDATGRIWTRADLNRHALGWSETLPPGLRRQRVAYALPNGPEWLAAFLGLQHRDCTVIPLDIAEPAGAQREQARSAHADFLFTENHLEPLHVPASRGPAPRHALVKLTSGSTGRPQALAFTHAQMLADGRQVCAGMDIRPEDLNLAVIPFGHSYGLGNLVMPLLAQGTAMVCVGTPLPHAIAADIARHHPTVFPSVPALIRALTDSDLPADTFAPIRTLISAGAPLTAESASAFHRKFNVIPHGFYGSSETGGICYDRDGRATLEGSGVGLPLPGVTITPVRGRRIRVTGAAVVRPSGFSPADRVEILPDGGLRLLGRAGRLVKIAGRRLDLFELETTLRRLPGIDDALVVAHPQHPETLAAALATRLSPHEIRGLLRGHLAAWKIPRRLVIRERFPLTGRGKTDTRALRALIEQ